MNLFIMNPVEFFNIFISVRSFNFLQTFLFNVTEVLDNFALIYRNEFI